MRVMVGRSSRLRTVDGLDILGRSGITYEVSGPFFI
jgi:hypothetical protein